jgi:hypothetical protein
LSETPTPNQKAEQAAKDMAAAYARLFLGSPDGKRVLADLVAKFPPDAARFDLAAPEPLKAAIRDGQATVTREVQSAIRLGAKLAGLSYPTT